VKTVAGNAITRTSANRHGLAIANSAGLEVGDIIFTPTQPGPNGHNAVRGAGPPQRRSARVAGGSRAR
jgi:hypothetical protein